MAPENEHKTALRIVTLMVRHGSEQYPNAKQELDVLFARTLPEIDRTTIIVDNSLPMSEVQTLSDRETLLGGDNEHWEFSAWDRALAHVGDRIWTYDLVHLVTSAFNTLSTGHLHRFSTKMLRALRDRPACLGHIDSYNDAIRIGPFRSQHWVRTSFLFVPPAELKALGSLVSFHDSHHLFTDDPAKPFSANGPISKNYQNYLLGWLTGSGTGQGVQWHSRFSLDESSLPYFKKKAEAILNEHMLAIRLRALGCRMIDTTWLATQMPKDWRRALRRDTSWRAQLSERDVDRVIPLN